MMKPIQLLQPFCKHLEPQALELLSPVNTREHDRDDCCANDIQVMAFGDSCDLVASVLALKGNWPILASRGQTLLESLIDDVEHQLLRHGVSACTRAQERDILSTQDGDTHPIIVPG